MRRKRTSPQEQLRLIQACRQSGWTDFDWCQEHGIPPATFYGWIHRLKQKGEMEIPAGVPTIVRKEAKPPDIVKEDVDYMPPVEDDEEEEEKAPLYMVTCRTLNVRMGPGTSYAKLGTFSRGTLISGEYENGWVKFTYNGQTAYSSADYLMQVDSDLSGLHVTCRTLNVRAGAGTNFDILGTLSRGTEISVRDVLPGWYEIDFLGGIGYVSSAYIG